MMQTIIKRLQIVKVLLEGVSIVSAAIICGVGHAVVLGAIKFFRPPVKRMNLTKIRKETLTKIMEDRATKMLECILRPELKRVSW